MSPFFFLTGTKFETHAECLIGLMIPPPLSFISSSYILGAKVGFMGLFSFLKGLSFSLSGITCLNKSSLYNLTSSYDQEKTCLYFLNNSIIDFRISGEGFFPTYTLGESAIPRLTSSSSSSFLSLASEWILP